MKRKIIFSLILVGLTLISCKDSVTDSEKDSKWYEVTKAEILKQTNLKADSIVLTYNKDSTFKEEHFYFNGNEFLSKGHRNDVFFTERNFSKSKDFELRKTLFDDGSVFFEGILYKGKFFGRSTWYYNNGKTEQQGDKYNNEKIGVWRKWDEGGNIIEEVDYEDNGIEKIDPMPVIEA